MQKIFSIDFSNSPIALTLNAISNKDIHVENVEFIDVDEKFFTSIIENTFDINVEKKILSAIESFIKKTNANNYNTIVLVPPIEQVSLNITLPFSNAPKRKNMDKIVLGEIQDLTPFSGDEWHVQYQVLKKATATPNLQLHVSLLPENIFKNVLKLLNHVGIDPFIITTPATVLGVVNYLVDKSYFKLNAVIIDRWGDFIHSLYVYNGVQVHERCIPIRLNGVDVSKEDILSQLKIMLRAFEKDTDSQISTIYYGNNISDDFVKGLGKSGEPLDFYQLINFDKDKSKLAFSSLSSYLVQDSMPFSLSNFRVGKFDCLVKVPEVIKIFKSFIPITVLFLIFLLVGGGTSYFLRERRISSIYDGIYEAVSSEVPVTVKSSRDVIEAIADARNKMEDNLLQISSSYTISPSKILEILSLDLSAISGKEISTFDFKANHLKLVGVVPSYSDFEKLQKILGKRKNIFRKIEAKQSVGRGQNIDFTVEIEIIN